MRHGTVLADGQAIKRARLAKGWSREKMLEQMSHSKGTKVSKGTVGNAESGRPVYIDTLRRIASVLEVSPEDLYLKAAEEPRGEAPEQATAMAASSSRGHAPPVPGREKIGHMTKRPLAEEHVHVAPSASSTLREADARPIGAIPHRNPTLFGQDALLAELTYRVLAFSRGVEGRHLTSVQGMPGSGKTTIATAVAYAVSNSVTVLWKSLGKKTDPLAVLQAWCQQLGVPRLLDPFLTRLGQDSARTIAQAAGDHFRAYLLQTKQQILFVLDDAWVLQDDWGVDRVRPLLVDGGNCGTLVTTRLPKLVEGLDVPAGDRKQPPLLEGKDALDLLRDRVGDEIVERHLAACRALVGKLAGLPLALVVAAGVIRRSVRLGHAVAEIIDDLTRRTKRLLSEPAPPDVQQFLADAESPSVVALLQMSTDELDDETFRCFALLGHMTPSEDATFDLKRMAWGWGLPEDRARGVADALIENGLMQFAGALEGEPRYYMHDLLIQHAKTLTEEQ